MATRHCLELAFSSGTAYVSEIMEALHESANVAA
jgi:hypothetical protein